MSLLDHAKRELALLGCEDDEMQQAMNKHILGMVELFAKEGHSGFSAHYAMGIDWMSRPRLSQAIPPAYSRWIGQRALAALEASA